MSENKFVFEGVTHEAVNATNGCEGCNFSPSYGSAGGPCSQSPACAGLIRKDHRSIIWVPVTEPATKDFLFTVTLRGNGATVEEAWDDAKDGEIDFYDSVEEEA